MKRRRRGKRERERERESNDVVFGLFDCFLREREGEREREREREMCQHFSCSSTTTLFNKQQ